MDVPSTSEKFPQPGRMGRPGRCGDYVSIDVGLIHGNIPIFTARPTDFGTNRRVGAYISSLHNSRCRQDLSTMANRGNGLLRSRKVP